MGSALHTELEVFLSPSSVGQESWNFYYLEANCKWPETLNLASVCFKNSSNCVSRGPNVFQIQLCTNLDSIVFLPSGRQRQMSASRILKAAISTNTLQIYILVVGITNINSVSFIIVISAQILQSTLWILKPDAIHDCNLVVNIYSSEAEQPTM